MADLLRPKDLKQITIDTEMEKMEEERKLKHKKEQDQLELREAFMSREIHPEAIDRINRAVRIAAQDGRHQIQVLTFPNTFCSDGGRRINIADPEWPSTLEGFAKKPTISMKRSCALLDTSFTQRSLAFLAACPATSASS